MKSLITAFHGSKTYTLVIVAIAYIAGNKLGFWAVDPEILILIGAGLAATLRAGIRADVDQAVCQIAAKKPAPAARSNRHIQNIIPILLLATVATGCLSPKPGHDPVVIRAEQTLAITLDTADAFLRLDHKHRDTIGAEANYLADQIRSHLPTHLETARLAIVAYKHNRTPDNRANLATALATIDIVLAHSQAALFNHTAITSDHGPQINP